MTQKVLTHHGAAPCQFETSMKSHGSKKFKNTQMQFLAGTHCNWNNKRPYWLIIIFISSSSLLSFLTVYQSVRRSSAYLWSLPSESNQLNGSWIDSSALHSWWISQACCINIVFILIHKMKQKNGSVSTVIGCWALGTSECSDYCKCIWHFHHCNKSKGDEEDWWHLW